MRYFYLITLLCFTISKAFTFSADISSKTLLDLLEPQFLSSFPLDTKKEPHKTEKKSATHIPLLSAREKASASCRALRSIKNNPLNLSYQNSIATPQVWKNLDLFSTQHGNRKKTVVARIANTKTIAGSLVLSSLIAQPITDIPTLITERQQPIRALCNNPKLLESLEQMVDAVYQEESNILSLINPTDALYQPDFYIMWFSSSLFGQSAKSANKSKLLQDTISAASAIPTIGFGIYTTLLAYKRFSLPAPLTPLQSGALCALPLLSFGLFFYNMHFLKKVKKSFIETKQRFKGLHTLAHTTNKLATLTENATFMPQDLRHALQQYHDSISHSDELSSFISSLRESSIADNRYWLSDGTPLFNAYLLLKNHIASALSALYCIGLIDAYCALARMIMTYQDTPNKFCFVTYKDAPAPFIEAIDFWHPCIQNHVVTNSLTLGEAHPSHLVITGVNAGGKSTIMKSIATNLILGQTLGIASAQSFTFTPFHKIYTYLNITDDLSNQQSLFSAELFRAHTLLEGIDALPRGEFSFTLLDEIFTGTERVEGEAAAYGVARKLSEFPQNITLLATHFQGLTFLEQDTHGTYKNMKVVVEQADDASFIYPFKLLAGKTDQQIAIDMIQKEGFDSIILEKAREVLNNPFSFLPTEADI